MVEALRAGAGRVAVVYLQERSRQADVVEAARLADVPVEERELAALDNLARGLRHQGVVAVAGEYPYRSLDEILEQAGKPPLLVALDQLNDPHNFGAIVRSAVAFGADGIISLKDRAVPVTPAVVRTSAGATERARITRVTNLASTLKRLGDEGMQVVGLDAASDNSLEQLATPPEGRVLVVGSEGKGLRRLVRERCHTLAAVPLYGPLASLNASVAAGIAIYLSTRGRG